MGFPVKTAIGFLCVAAIGGLVYGWGTGLFFPCGPLDRFINTSNCRILAHWENTEIEAVLTRAEDTSIDVVLRGPGREPTAPQQLVEIAVSGGATGQSITLADVPPSIDWIGAKADSQGRTVLASFYQERVWLLERATGRRLAIFDGKYNVGRFGFSRDEQHVLIDTEYGSFDRPVALTASKYQMNGTLVGEVTGEETWPIYQTGISSALTVDGKFMVQHEMTRADTNVVALRLVDTPYLDWAGKLMLANVGAWLSQMLPYVFISPDGRHVAASFDSSDEWGQTNSALVVWEIETQKVATIVPTWRAPWKDVVWLGDGLLAASRLHYQIGSSDLALIRYERSTNRGSIE
jgi:hypothetical protein